VLKIVLSFLFIPTWGLLGAAIASAGTTILWNVILVVIARRRLGIMTISLSKVIFWR
jgi:O-antigen/teichoic acid export membrane protein